MLVPLSPTALADHPPRGVSADSWGARRQNRGDMTGNETGRETGLMESSHRATDRDLILQATGTRGQLCAQEATGSDP